MISQTLNIGRAGQYLVMIELLLKGVQCFDTAEGVNFDVVFIHNKKLVRLQVKTTKGKRTRVGGRQPLYYFQLQKNPQKNSKNSKKELKHYHRDDFEAFALVMLDRREVCYLKFDERVKTNSVCLRDRDEHYSDHGEKHILYLQDLTFENFLTQLG